MSHPEDEFDEVRRLLGCKRHELPPPGFFISFSDKIIARIQTEETIQNSSWWDWLVQRIDAKPVLVCAYGVAVSGLLVMGFRLSQAFDAEAAMSPAVSGPWLAVAPLSPISLTQELTQDGGWMGSPTTRPPDGISKLAMRDDPRLLFAPASNYHVQPVSFTLPPR